MGPSHHITNILASGATNGRNKFTIGYGPGGGDPFILQPDERLILKLSASGDYCDWGFIEQGISGRARGRRRPQEEIDFKGAWIVGVVGKR